MKFTDLFIRRPVLATVISLMILVIGLRAFMSLPILQFPRTENAVVTVATTYYGADADTVAGFITTPLENAIAQANGIDYMNSTSQNGVSTITVNLRLNYDSDKALTEISAKISSVLNQLPPGSQQPILTIQIGQSIDAMYLGFGSDVLAQNNITDYLVRVVQPKLQAVEGVQTAEILGAQNFALRAWLDPAKLAAYGLTATDVSTALAKNDYIAGLGNTKGQMVQINLNASTGLHSVEEFRNLVVKQQNGAIVRLGDVANVTLGSDDYESRIGFDGKQAVYIGIQVAPAANLLDVIKGVRKVFPDIQSQLPQGLNGRIVYDSTAFVNSSINEVVYTLIEALLIVSLVVFAFLGSPRSVIIPVIAIPLSLTGALIFMLALHFSINLLTLLALVLAIGLVVDDAIIVVENVNRHIEEGMKPMDAAIRAARELGNPIIAMTIVLVAVYVPIGFQGGLTGALFTEFAFTLVGAVTISGVVALTLSPMMCSRLFKEHHGGETHGAWFNWIAGHANRGFDYLYGPQRPLFLSYALAIILVPVFVALAVFCRKFLGFPLLLCEAIALALPVFFIFTGIADDKGYRFLTRALGAMWRWALRYFPFVLIAPVLFIAVAAAVFFFGGGAIASIVCLFPAIPLLLLLVYSAIISIMLMPLAFVYVFLREGNYHRLLTSSLNFLPVTLVFALIVFCSIYFLYSFAQNELAPQEDQGVLISFITPSATATLQQKELYQTKIYQIFSSYPETAHVFQLDTPGRVIAGMVLTPWDERPNNTSNDLSPLLQKQASAIAGVKAAIVQLPSLPGSQGYPVEFVITTTQSYQQLNEVMQNFITKAQASGMFIFSDTDLKFDLPQATVVIDRDKTAQLGLNMTDVGSALGSMLGGGYVNYFSLSGRSYKVIPQVQQVHRLNTDQLNNYYVTAGSGAPVALSTIAQIKMETIPESLNHFQQQNSATFQAVPFPGVSVGDAVASLQKLAKTELPQGYSVDYSGPVRQYIQEANGLTITLFGVPHTISSFLITLFFAVIIIFLTLSAQFESFRDPLIILISVPMSIAGALIFIMLGVRGATINVYTQVGIVTLVGLISKHGILITEFANNLQAQGRSKRDAIIEAASIRLRPILMTTAAMVLGVVPLLTATGAGALSRQQLGLVIASGLAIGTLFTLFVVPAVYMALAADHHAKRQEAAEDALPEPLQTGE